MKRKGFLVYVVIGTEYERMSVMFPDGTIVFEGNRENFMKFLKSQIENFKNSIENENEIK